MLLLALCVGPRRCLACLAAFRGCFKPVETVHCWRRGAWTERHKREHFLTDKLPPTGLLLTTFHLLINLLPVFSCIFVWRADRGDMRIVGTLCVGFVERIKAPRRKRGEWRRGRAEESGQPEERLSHVGIVAPLLSPGRGSSGPFGEAGLTGSNPSTS